MSTLIHKRNASGFTLVELLVVISIIALLVSLMLPALGKAREQGRKTLCMNNERQMGVALINYAGQYKEYLPYASNTAGMHASPVTLVAGLVVQNQFLPHTRQSNYGWTESMYCPSDPNLDAYIASNSYPLSYRYRQTHNGSAGPTYSTPATGQQMRLGFSHVKYLRFLVLERYATLEAGRKFNTPGKTQSFTGTRFSYPDNVSFQTYWHVGAKGGNTLYEDGHVKWVAFEQPIGGPR